jgi:methylmalonyl-CoA mutase N-terminal domain/subunit
MKNPKSMALHTRSPDGVWRRRTFNNVPRTCVEAWQRRWTTRSRIRTLDEAIALPTDFSARIARNTDLLQEETGITKVVDPKGSIT